MLFMKVLLNFFELTTTTYRIIEMNFFKNLFLLNFLQISSAFIFTGAKSSKINIFVKREFSIVV